jgi:hypothetical protein
MPKSLKKKSHSKVINRKSRNSKRNKRSKKSKKSKKSKNSKKTSKAKFRKSKKSKKIKKVKKSVKKVSKSLKQIVNIEVNLFEKNKNTSIDQNEAIHIISKNYKKIELWYKFNIFQMYGLRNLKVVYKNKNHFIISFKSAFIFQKCHMELLADPDFEERYVVILEKEIKNVDNKNLVSIEKITYNIHGNLV